MHLVVLFASILQEKHYRRYNWHGLDDSRNWILANVNCLIKHNDAKTKQLIHTLTHYSPDTFHIAVKQSKDMEWVGIITDLGQWVSRLF